MKAKIGIVVATVFASAAATWSAFKHDDNAVQTSEINNLKTGDQRAVNSENEWAERLFNSMLIASPSPEADEEPTAEDLRYDMEDAFFEQEYQAMKSRLDEAIANGQLVEALKMEILSTQNPDSLDLNRYFKEGHDITQPLIDAVSDLLDNNTYIDTSIMFHIDSALGMMINQTSIETDIRAAQEGIYAQILDDNFDSLPLTEQDYIQGWNQAFQEKGISAHALREGLTPLQHHQASLVSDLIYRGALDIDDHPFFAQLNTLQDNQESLSDKLETIYRNRSDFCATVYIMGLCLN